LERNRVFPIRHISLLWAIIFVALVCYAMTWYFCAYILQELIAGFQGAYSFPSGADTVVTVLQYVIAWHPLIVIFGWIAYGYLSSARTDYRGDYVG